MFKFFNYIIARKPQAFKPGDEWHPERSQQSWRSPCDWGGGLADFRRFLGCSASFAAIILDIYFVVIYISVRWLNGKMGIKMLPQPAQQKSKFLYFSTIAE
jgi:hypothetical protein